MRKIKKTNCYCDRNYIIYHRKNINVKTFCWVSFLDKNKICLQFFKINDETAYGSKQKNCGFHNIWQNISLLDYF